MPQDPRPRPPKPKSELEILMQVLDVLQEAVQILREARADHKVLLGEMIQLKAKTASSGE